VIEDGVLEMGMEVVEGELEVYELVGICVLFTDDLLAVGAWGGM